MISVISFLAMFASLALAPPAFDDIRAAWRPSDIRVLDRHGAVVHEVRVDIRRRRLAWTAVNDVSPALIDAVLAAEDRRFGGHRGVDGRALAAAAWQRVRHGSVRGASTITMQVAAMVDPALGRSRGARTAAEKWRQMRLAWGLEARWSKRQILETYLNLVTFRGELQGVAAGAAVLFDKSPHGLDDGEAAVLAALLRAPNAAPEHVARRAARLQTAPTASVAAAATRAGMTAAGTGPRVSLARHAATRLVRGQTGAGDVSSTLDLDVQRTASAALVRHLSEVRGRHVEDGAVLVVDNASGEVLAYVGSSGSLSSAPLVDGVQAPRQAGSTLKPLLYGLALDEKRLTAAALVDDSPLEIAVSNGLYRPHNYDERFRGLVSVRTALASSLNVPAVRTLRLVGEEPFVGHLRRLGFPLREAGSFYGPALALGSADVTLWDLVGAYRMLANAGRAGTLTLTRDADRLPGHRALSPAAAFVTADVLADRESRSVTFGLENVLATPFWTAVKTGTSKDMRDNWCIGFSRRYTVGVWVGNFSGESMWNVSGMTGAAPIWRDVMMWLHRETPSVPPTAPTGLIRARVAAADGEPSRDEWFLAGTEPPSPTTRAAVAAPAIVAPVRGTRIAIDPDIPATHQRVAFEARHAAPDTRWLLDGVDVGRGSLVLWPLHPGRHTLAIVDRDGQIHDTTQFDVRGASAD